MTINKPYQGPEDLPTLIPIFPLSGALLLPRGQLPLTVSEARYLQLVDDSLQSHRLVGIIQPLQEEENPMDGPAKLYPVGGLGRITQFAETGQNRYIINLTGITRFQLVNEISVSTPYRQCIVEYDSFSDDFITRIGENEVDRAGILRTLRDFAHASELKIDWTSVENTPNEPLVNALAMLSPFGPKEKQALLEAPDLKYRADVLVAITEVELARGKNASHQVLQ